MISETVVELSRWQFAATAMFHFVFVPLTLGLSVLLAIMESVYVMTGKEIYREMTKFWGKLFGINFALGVATGITMEFQFGLNWSYYSHYVGDIFGTPLAIEGLMAFFLESTFIGLFFFGWQRLSKVQHLTVTWLVALGSNFPALWILVANGWMQNPVGAAFNFETMRMELVSFAEVFFNPVAQVKFVHTVAAGYVTGAAFVLGVSAWYMLKGRHMAFARRSFAIASAFGLASALSVVTLGDESGYTMGDSQRMKLAAIEAAWETHEAPAPFTAIGFPDQDRQVTHAAVEIPWIMGIVATRSVDKPVIGIKDLVKDRRRWTRCRMWPPPSGPSAAWWALALRCWCSSPGRCGCRPSAPSIAARRCCGSRCCRSRCPGSPPSLAGTWPRWAASPGPWAACCRPSCRLRV